jgi:hypothetical protein
MNLEDSKHNLKIVGKILIILGFIAVPISLFSYQVMNIITSLNLWDGKVFYLGPIEYDRPFFLFYILPSIHALMAILLIVTGIGLVQHTPWARKLAYVPAVILLFYFPFGTALGIYLIFLLEKERQQAISQNTSS